jgi:uncharacterized delta-60 repeat protein
VLAAAPCFGAAGDLDPAFGHSGRVETNLRHDFAPRDAAVQGDGKILVTGGFYNTRFATIAFSVVRFQANGALDTSFGTQGVALTAFTNFINTGNSIAIQDDGKIVVAGEASSADGKTDEWAVARFNIDGTPDATFGNGGRVATNFLSNPPPGFHQAANVVVVQPNGKILAGGVVVPAPEGNHESAFARYNADGTLDTTFGTGGKLALLSIGDVIALGLTSEGEIVALNSAGLIAQFSPTGTPQIVAGKPLIKTARMGPVTFEGSGRYFVATVVQGPGGENDLDVRIIRFAATGAIDPTFQSPLIDFGPTGPLESVAQSIAVAPDGRVVVGGIANITASSTAFGVARVNTDGSLDTTFGGDGSVTTAFHGSDQVVAVVVQPDGNIVAAGQTLNHTTNVADIALARYLGQ